MKEIFILQIMDLSRSSIRIGQYAFQSKDEAQKHIRSLENAYAEIDDVSLKTVKKRYVFNIVSVELC